MITSMRRPVLAGTLPAVEARRIDALGQKVRLRDVRPEDRRVLSGFDRDAQVDGYRHGANHRASVTDSVDAFHFAIETVHTRTVVGSIWVQTDPLSSMFSYGIGIGGPHRRCGYARDAISTLLTTMFDERGYYKCQVSVSGRNFASLALHGDLGFREESRPRDTELVLGQVRYPVLMGIAAPEFAATRPRANANRRARHARLRRGGEHRR